MVKLLGVDIGTSSVKALVFDTDTAQLLAVAGQEYPIKNPKPGYAEQNPEDWWQAAIVVINKVIQASGTNDIAAIGLTGQMHGATLIDENHLPLGDSIIWADQRSTAEVQQMVDVIGKDKLTGIAGTMPAVGFMGPTLLWLKKHKPGLLAQVRHVLLPKDYLRLKLTGEVATDMSDAAATALFDITEQDWSLEIIGALELPPEIFPVVYVSSAVAGELTNGAAKALGLKKGIPVVAGCADQPAQALANGLIAPGQVSVTLGTGGQVCAPLRIKSGEKVPTDPRLHVFNHAVPEMWYTLGAILSAGLSLRWLRDTVGLANHKNAYTILSQEAAKVATGADGLIFLPYLVGERTPHMDGHARGAFIGLTYHHTRGHMARAVMEGVAFALRQTLEICLSLTGSVEQVIASGGGAESDLWRQIQADVYGLPLQQTLVSEQTAVGAAILAGIGTGVYASPQAAKEAIINYGVITEPNTKTKAKYDALYQQFVELYPRLRDDFHKLAGE